MSLTSTKLIHHSPVLHRTNLESPYPGSRRIHTTPSTNIIRRSLEWAKNSLNREPSPPAYSRGAWSIISDVPYPPPPPYAGNSHHPPTYSEAMEIGVVASPMLIERRMMSR